MIRVAPYGPAMATATASNNNIIMLATIEITTDNKTI